MEPISPEPETETQPAGPVPLPVETVEQQSAARDGNDDQCHPELLLPDQMALAVRAFEQFLERAVAPMLEFFCTPAELRFSGSSQGSDGQAEEGVRLSLNLSPLPGNAHLVFSPQFAGMALALLMGASPEQEAEPRTVFTGVEMALLRPLLESLASELKQAWKPFCPAAFLPLAEPVPADSGMLALAAEVTVRGVAGTMELWIPSLLIRLATGQTGETATPDQRTLIIEALEAARFDVEAVISGASIRIRDLLDLRAGRTLELPYSAGSPVDCRVNGIVKFRGDLVLNGNGLGFEVGTLVEPERRDPAAA